MNLHTTSTATSHPALSHERGRRPRESLWPGILLGASLGGFVDGIAFHQIVQWHNMGSSVLPPTTMEAMHQNMAWDGWLHAATLVTTLIGIYLLVHHAGEGRRLPSLSRFTGLLLLGWGFFNVIEGVIDHELLHIHHIRDLPEHVPAYDWIFGDWRDRLHRYGLHHLSQRPQGDAARFMTRSRR